MKRRISVAFIHALQLSDPVTGHRAPGAEGGSGLFVHHHPAPMKTIGDRKIRGGRDS
ncbi:MAG TPA: hypothetical protein VHB01_13330 [Nitrosospira sp.]|nr:hypothetical protein [Nitrosospira sp.]